MSAYEVLLTHEPSPVEANEVTLIASGDLRESANKVCWPAQAKMEGGVIAAFESEGVEIRRAHPFDQSVDMVSSRASAWALA
jgi:hypothetical protein